MADSEYELEAIEPSKPKPPAPPGGYLPRLTYKPPEPDPDDLEGEAKVEGEPTSQGKKSKGAATGPKKTGPTPVPKIREPGAEARSKAPSPAPFKKARPRAERVGSRRTRSSRRIRRSSTLTRRGSAFGLSWEESRGYFCSSRDTGFSGLSFPGRSLNSKICHPRLWRPLPRISLRGNWPASEGASEGTSGRGPSVCQQGEDRPRPGPARTAQNVLQELERRSRGGGRARSAGRWVSSVPQRTDYSGQCGRVGE